MPSLVVENTRVSVTQTSEAAGQTADPTEHWESDPGELPNSTSQVGRQRNNALKVTTENNLQPVSLHVWSRESSVTVG